MWWLESDPQKLTWHEELLDSSSSSSITIWDLMTTLRKRTAKLSFPGERFKRRGVYPPVEDVGGCGVVKRLICQYAVNVMGTRRHICINRMRFMIRTMSILISSKKKRRKKNPTNNMCLNFHTLTFAAVKKRGRAFLLVTPPRLTF